MRLFQARGFDEVTVAQIAAAAGVSVPTFYAHFAVKEQIVLPVPSAEDFAPFLTLEPSDLPLAERMQRLAPHWFAHFDPEERAAIFSRWRVVASTPRLRLRAAEYERATAETALAAFTAAGVTLTLADRVAATAVLVAFTSAFLAWADSDGQQTLEDATRAAFEALQTL